MGREARGPSFAPRKAYALTPEATAGEKGATEVKHSLPVHWPSVLAPGRVKLARGRQRENLDTVFGHAHRMLELRRE